jgi:translation initiation factor 1 (eIF-1/SUI1)
MYMQVSVESLPGKTKDKEVTMQGNMEHKLVKYLEDEFGLQKHLTEVVLGKGMKKKK